MTTSRTLRWLFYNVVAAFEATRVYLVVALLAIIFPASSVNWLVLYLIVLAAALAGKWQARAPHDRWRMPAIGLLVILWALKVQLLGGILPWQGWHNLARLELGSGYVILLLLMWCWWRGLGLLDHDHTSLVLMFRRTILTVTILGMLFGFLGGFGAINIDTPAVLLAAIGALALGLMSLVLARTINEAATEGASGSSWHWVRGGAGTIATILLLGIALLALFSAPAATLLQNGLVALVLIGLLLVAPLVAALSPLVDWLGSRASAPITPSPLQQLVDEPPRQAASQLATYMLQIPIYLLFLLPLLILVAAILLFRRRAVNAGDDQSEVHESLFSWAAVGQDLRDLLARPRTSGLRDVLHALRGGDPVSRVRRRYIQVLLLAEAADHARQAHQTPAEYQPALNAAVPYRDSAVQTLTDRYQRARYAPESTTEADAVAADAAWESLSASTEKP